MTRICYHDRVTTYIKVTNVNLTKNTNLITINITRTICNNIKTKQRFLKHIHQFLMVFFFNENRNITDL